MIVVDPSGQSFIRHDEEERFRFGARDIQTQQVGGETRTVVFRPDGSQDHHGRRPRWRIAAPDSPRPRRPRDHHHRQRLPRSGRHRQFLCRSAAAVIRIPYDRYIVEADVAGPDVIYETLEAPPVDRIERRYYARRNPLQPVGADADAEHRSQHHQLRDRVVGNSA